jgi:hypothetical protein
MKKDVLLMVSCPYMRSYIILILRSKLVLS